MDYIRSIFSRSSPVTAQASSAIPQHPKYQPVAGNSPVFLAEDAIKNLPGSLSHHLQQNPGNLDPQVAAWALGTLSSQWQIICDNSRGRDGLGTSYGSEQLTKHALDTLTLLDRATQDPASTHKPIIASFQAQIKKMQEEVTSLGSHVETIIFLSDGTYLNRIVPLIAPATPAAPPAPVLPAPVNAPTQQTTLPKPSIFESRDPPTPLQVAAEIQGALIAKRSPSLIEIQTLLGQNIQSNEAAIGLYTLISKLSDQDAKMLFETGDNRAREHLYRCFDAMMERTRDLSIQPELLSYFCTYFQRVLSFPDFAFHPKKERMISHLEVFLVQYAKMATAENSATIQSLFGEIFSRASSKANRVEIRALFAAYDQFVSAHKPAMQLHDRLAILHLANTFPDISGPLREKLSSPFTKHPELTHLGNLVANPATIPKEHWKDAAIRTIYNTMQTITPSNALETFSLLYAQIDLLRRSGFIKDANELSFTIACFARNMSSDQTPSLFLNAWDARLGGLQQLYRESPLGTNLESFEREAEKLASNADSFFRGAAIGLTQTNATRQEELHRINAQLIYEIREARFLAAAERSTNTIQSPFDQFSIPAQDAGGNFCDVPSPDYPEGSTAQPPNGPLITFTNKMPGRAACVMIAGYTAKAMLQGQMTGEDALHRAMLMGISRYQDVVRGTQNDGDQLKIFLSQFAHGEEVTVHDGEYLSSFHLHALNGLIDPGTAIDTLQERTFSIPEKGADLAWKEKLDWLMAEKRAAAAPIAAVIIKGSSAFSIMIQPNGVVHVTDSHSPGFGKEGAFSKRFASIEHAALFLSALYPYAPEAPLQNQVEFVPVFLQQADPHGVEARDARYAATCMPVVKFLRPPNAATPPIQPVRVPNGLTANHIRIIRAIQNASTNEKMSAAITELSLLEQKGDAIAQALKRNPYFTFPSGSTLDEARVHLQAKATQLLSSIAAVRPATLSRKEPALTAPRVLKTDDQLIADFYAGYPIPSGRGDCSGLMLADIIQRFSDEDLERNHNFIQWLFPTTDPSQAQPLSPYYRNVAAIPRSAQFQRTMKAALARVRDFYTASPTKITEGDHNCLRVTRIISSLRLHGLFTEAEEFHAFATAIGKRNGVSEATLGYWNRALRGSL